MKTKKTIYIEIPITTFKDGKWFIAHHKKMDLFAQEKTEQEAERFFMGFRS